MNSIIDGTRNGKCFLCGKSTHTYRYPIFGARNKTKSFRDGLTVYLCRDCYITAGSNFLWNVRLKEMGEAVWIDTYQKKIDDFEKEYGRNYIGYLGGRK